MSHWFGVITLMPDLFASLRDDGVVARALRQQIIMLELSNPRDFVHDVHSTVDDRPYGGGPGMVLKAEPLAAALQSLRDVASARGLQPKVVLMSPQGRRFDQSTAVDAVDEAVGLILICGRYEGVDERFIEQHIDEEWSIGDFVVSGGELPAMLVIDAIARQIPGTLGNAQSKIGESHLDGLLDYPHYTRPEKTGNSVVPGVLLSGDHTRVGQYRRREALQRTFERRPDMLVQRTFTEPDRTFLQEYFTRKYRDDKARSD